LEFDRRRGGTHGAQYENAGHGAKRSAHREHGVTTTEAEKRKQQEFFELAERFRGATDPDEVKRLGAQRSRIVFGD
jgi:hypothetical protein